MTTIQTIFFALGCAALYRLICWVWPKVVMAVLMLNFHLEYWCLTRRIRQAERQVVEVAPVAYTQETAHTKHLRESYSRRRDRIGQAIRREHEEARAMSKEGK